MSHQNIVSFLMYFLILSTSLAQLIEPKYFYDNTPYEENVLKIQIDDYTIPQGPTTLNDILPMEKDLTTFIDKLDDKDESLTLFAPINKVFHNVTNKPSYVTSSSEDPMEKIRRFVLAHIVPKSSKLHNGEELDTLLVGTKVEVKSGNDGNFILNEKANTGMTKEAVNGRFYKIDATLI
ncbi:16485_t:CDS:2 [Gigaspora margarita]|uniref:16485_t:CDS:1 n=1 Tax=Gigaspora margarita TaxID=4874 RepID=A0ABN7VVG1_GIGMA|nr:16485_t:CDS:2 [Gigaspora margarita]